VSKYNSTKIEYNGMRFDSKKELKRYQFLKEMENQGKINDLKCQVKYVLIPSQRIDGKVIERECKYIADFEYLCNGEKVVEDVKGYRGGPAYSLYTIKRKLMLEKYGVRIHEI